MSVASQIKEWREKQNLTLEEVAERAQISKTYLWELEQDLRGEKKPSADVLLRIAKALSTTIADLLELPEVRVGTSRVGLTPSLVEFRDWMKRMGEPIADSDLKDLAQMRFRNAQPRTKDDWFELYRTLKRATGESGGRT